MRAPPAWRAALVVCALLWLLGRRLTAPCVPRSRTCLYFVLIGNEKRISIRREIESDAPTECSYGQRRHGDGSP